MKEHYFLSEVVRDAVCYDQYDLSNSAAFERVCRRLQMIEHHWPQRSELGQIGDRQQGRLDPLTEDLFAGNRNEVGNLMVSPLLLM